MNYYRDKKRVRIWDSSNPLAEEYVRACAFSQREQYASIDPTNSFIHLLIAMTTHTLAIRLFPSPLSSCSMTFAMLVKNCNPA
jgi:hypothetical protein